MIEVNIKCTTIIQPRTNKGENSLLQFTPVKKGPDCSQKMKQEMAHLNNIINLFVKFQATVKSPQVSYSWFDTQSRRTEARGWNVDTVEVPKITHPLCPHLNKGRFEADAAWRH